MKLWIDDVRPAPNNYIWLKTVNETIDFILKNEKEIELIDLDHDAGVYFPDYIKILDWLEETGRNYPIRIHSMNPVGRENMRAIIQRNSWIEMR